MKKIMILIIASMYISELTATTTFHTEKNRVSHSEKAKTAKLKRLQATITNAKSVYKKFSTKYKQETVALTLGKNSKDLKEALITCAEDKRTKKKGGLFSTLMIGYNPNKTLPLVKYSNRVTGDHSRLKYHKHKLSKIDNDEAKKLIVEISSLMDNLQKIKTSIKSSREYREEQRFVRTDTQISDLRTDAQLARLR